jgi:predicted transcriptional regulator
MIQDIFETLGFKEEDVKIYLGLLENGARTAGDLSKTLGVPRPTLYGQLERLVASGLAREDLQRGVKVFVPEPAEKLRVLYRNKIRDLRLKERNLDAVIPQLEKSNGASLLRPRLTTFEGKKEFRAALEDVLTSKGGGMTYCLWPMRGAMEMVSPEFMRFHARERIRRNVPVRGIWPRSQGVDISAYPYLAWGPELKSELRYAPLGTELVMGYWIYGYKILFLSQQGDISGYTIESAEMAEMMTAQHAALWKNSEPVPFDKNAAQDFVNEMSIAA